jgi:hypothetical protein
MAGDWIKMRTNLDTDPAVVRIASGLQTDRYSVVGRLHKIWSWANEHLTDGHDVPIDAEFLDCLVETPGFSAQLRNVGWLSGRDGSLSFPSFERHNGASAKARAQDAARKKLVRSVQSNSPKCPVPNRTQTGPEKRRGEERREEVKKQKTDKADSPYLRDETFRKAFEDFKQSSRVNHHWTIAETTAEAWLMELSNLSIAEATKALWFSTSCGAKKPITNGDHNRRTERSESDRVGLASSAAGGKSTRTIKPKVSFEEGLLS